VATAGPYRWLSYKVKYDTESLAVDWWTVGKQSSVRSASRPGFRRMLSLETSGPVEHNGDRRFRFERLAEDEPLAVGGHAVLIYSWDCSHWSLVWNWKRTFGGPVSSVAPGFASMAISFPSRPS